MSFLLGVKIIVMNVYLFMDLKQQVFIKTIINDINQDEIELGNFLLNMEIYLLYMDQEFY